MKPQASIHDGKAVNSFERQIDNFRFVYLNTILFSAIVSAP